jgi:hypothetical protein
MGEVRRFVAKAQRIQQNIAAQIEAQLKLFPPDALPEQPLQALLNALQRFTRDPDDSLWPGGFSMLSRNQTAAIWGAIRKLPADKRPNHVRHAFDLVLLNLRQDTGEVMLTRDQLAEEIGCAPNHVSRVMGTLEEMGVIRRERRKVNGMKGRGIAVYFINPHVAWNGSLEVRKAKAAEEKTPLLTLMHGSAE